MHIKTILSATIIIIALTLTAIDTPTAYALCDDCKTKHIWQNDTPTFSLPYYRTNIKGTSMQPLVQEGDTAWKTKLRPKDTITEGDILTYWDGDHWVMHRVYKIRNKTITMKGDNNLKTDPIQINTQDIAEGKAYKVWMITKGIKVKYCA